MSREQATAGSTPDSGERGGVQPAASKVRPDGGTAAGEGEAAGDGVVRELGHDDFDPVGTLALILAYLAILVVMWFFMYFVEFLGNGPTVVG
jgi:hypothetical protein